MFNEDTDSLTGVADILQHFRERTRSAVYATAALLITVRVSVLAVSYAAYLSMLALRHCNLVHAALPCVSSVLASVLGAIML